MSFFRLFQVLVYDLVCVAPFSFGLDAILDQLT